MNEDDFEHMRQESLFDQGAEEDSYRINEAGLNEILGWCRFKLQTAELMGIPPEEDEEGQMALLVFFILSEAYHNRGLQIPDVS